MVDAAFMVFNWIEPGSYQQRADLRSAGRLEQGRCDETGGRRRESARRSSRSAKPVQLKRLCAIQPAAQASCLTISSGGCIMLQANEVQKRFDRIEQAIVQARQTCMADGNASPELKDCITKLDKESSKAKQVLQSQDEDKIRDCVDDLEMLGDEAKRACAQDTRANPQMKQAVTKVHQELSDLKHQLH
jgi:hypothetical protein